MLVTGIILIGIVFYAIWAVRKIHKNRKNGSCCSGSCSGCVADVFRFGGHRLFRIFAHSAGLHYNRICFLIGLHILPIGAV